MMTQRFVQTRILQASGMEGMHAICLMFSTYFVIGGAV
jgi:hypothetical protein